MRAVVDTNVVVSAVLSKASPPDRILQRWRRGEFQLITSAPLLEELDYVLSRSYIAQRLGWSIEELQAFVAGISRQSEIVAPSVHLEIIARDPDDNRILEAAVEGQSDYIVSGDNYVLELGAYQGIQIVSPSQFELILAELFSP